jgi:hypothetical protein
MNYRNALSCTRSESPSPPHLLLHRPQYSLTEIDLLAAADTSGPAINSRPRCRRRAYPIASGGIRCASALSVWTNNDASSRETKLFGQE